VIARASTRLGGLTGAAGDRVALGVVAVVTLAVGVVNSKVTALMVGPSGVGYLAVVQAMLNLVAVVAGLELGQAMIRFLPAAAAVGDVRLVEDRIVAARTVTAIGVTCVLVAALVSGGSIASVLLPPPAGRAAWLLVVIGAVAYCWTSLLIATLAALGATRQLVAASILSAVSTPVVTVVGYRVAGIDAVPAIAFVSAVLSLVTTLAIYRRVVRSRAATTRRRPSASWQLGQARELVGFAGPRMSGTLVRTGLSLAVPVIVARRAGLADAGQFRAALAIGAAFSSVGLMVLSYGFAPRAAAVGGERTALGRLSAAELLVVSTLANAAAQVGVVLAPVVVRVLYAAEFGAAAALLRAVVVIEVVWLVGHVFFFALSGASGGRMVAAATLSGPVVALVALFPLTAWSTTWGAVAALGVEAAVLLGVSAVLLRVRVRVGVGMGAVALAAVQTGVSVAVALGAARGWAAGIAGVPVLVGGWAVLAATFAVARRAAAAGGDATPRPPEGPVPTVDDRRSERQLPMATSVARGVAR